MRMFDRAYMKRGSGGGHHGRHAHRFGPRGFGGFGEEFGAGPGRGRGGGRRQRVFDGGELRLVLLKLIEENPRHGYDLIRAIEELTGGAYAPSPGVVYPTLTLLGEMDLICEQADGARKRFSITAEGSAHLAEHADAVAHLFARLRALGEMRERIDAVPVRRAMQNLRSVLQHRLGEGLDRERLHAAVELIDEAARKIERL